MAIDAYMIFKDYGDEYLASESQVDLERTAPARNWRMPSRAAW